jgi:hypothetical protein
MEQPSVRSICGTITEDGVAPASARVLLLDERLEQGLASTEALADGWFELACPDVVEGVVLARLRGPTFAVAYARVTLPTSPLRLDAANTAPCHDVQLLAAGDVPPLLDLAVSPTEVIGFPPGPAEMWTYRIDGNCNEQFSAWPLGDGRADVRLQSGRWRIGASRVEPPRGRLSGGGARVVWTLAGATDESGADLPFDGGCITVAVDGPRRLTLRIVRRGAA